MIFLQDRKGVIIHHTADPDDREGYDLSAIRGFHMYKRGWRDVGYNYVCEYVYGRPEIVLGRGPFEIGAHCRGFNRSHIGFAFCGNFSEDEPPHGLLEYAAPFVAALLLHTHGELLRHSDVAPTECPGLKFPWGHFKNLVQEHLS